MYVQKEASGDLQKETPEPLTGMATHTGLYG